jgi:hypothetical protein
VPDALVVIVDASVVRKLAQARSIQDGLAGPGFRGAPECGSAGLAIDVGLVIGEDEEGVVPEVMI